MQAVREACVAAAAAPAAGGDPPEAKRARQAGLVESGFELDGDGLPIVPKPVIPFSACLATVCGKEHIADYLSSATGAKGPALASTSFTRLPPYLFIVLNRYKM